MSAWASEHHLVLAQHPVESKSNEITAIPELLNLLDINGAIITLDAMGGDKYEQEADRVAAQVVNQINAPAPQQSDPSQSVQREAIPEEEDELQMKPEVGTIQREEVPEEEKELQRKLPCKLVVLGYCTKFLAVRESPE